jgi:hypothetical protein
VCASVQFSSCATCSLFTPYAARNVGICLCRQFFFEQYQQLDEELFSPNRAVFPADRFSYTSFSWAVASVRSKLHAPLDADPVALVPLADAVSAAWTSDACALMGCCSSLCMIAATIRMSYSFRLSSCAHVPVAGALAGAVSAA